MRLTLPKREYVVVSVGGSLIVPDQIDADFLFRFRELILRKVKEGLNFYIVTGGGKLHADTKTLRKPHVVTSPAKTLIGWVSMPHV